MTVPIWLLADSHLSSGWPWLHNVSTCHCLAKGGITFDTDVNLDGGLFNLVRFLHNDFHFIKIDIES